MSKQLCACNIHRDGGSPHTHADGHAREPAPASWTPGGLKFKQVLDCVNNFCSNNSVSFHWVGEEFKFFKEGWMPYRVYLGNHSNKTGRHYDESSVSQYLGWVEKHFKDEQWRSE